MLDKFIHSLKINDDEDETEGYLGSMNDDNEPAFEPRKKGNDLNRSYRGIADIHNTNIRIMKPRKLNDAKDIIDKLSEGNTVAVDLEYTKDSEKQRIMDMLAGYCYCTQSNIESINTNIYIISHTVIELDKNEQSE